MSYWFMGILAGLAGLIGLFMASGARDLGIMFFGMALALFAVLFCGFMIKRAFDEDEELAGTRHVIRE
jgi:hypothetical protein